jgi:hypothetical protein
MLDKIKQTLPLLSSHDFLLLFGAIVVYHFFLFLVMYFLFATPSKSRWRALEAAMADKKRQLDESWKDREAEIRMIMLQEKEREILQIKAEYDSYVKLLEQKLMRSRTKDSA